MEHLALKSTATLDEFCSRFRQSLDLPEFQFGAENATEWGFSEMDNIEYNVSKPYESGTLQQWDYTVPESCNFGISLILYREHPNATDHEWAVEHLVNPVAQKIANEFTVTVHFHRTWYASGENIQRDLTYVPAKGLTSVSR